MRLHSATSPLPPLGLLAASLLLGATVACAQSPVTVVDSFTTAVEFPVQGVMVRAQIHVARGPGPHPTIVEFKGFQQGLGWVAPRAHAEGYNGVSLDFRGQNGSGGRYAPDYTTADAAALLALLRTDRARRHWRIDPTRLVVVGTSAGTLAAMTTLANDPAVSCGGVIVPIDRGAAGMLVRGDSGIRRQFEEIASALDPERVRPEPGLVSRVADRAESINVRAAAARLAGKVVFLLGARRDETAPLFLHFQPLVAAARQAGARTVRDTIVDDTHNLPDTNEAVLDALYRWVRSDCLAR
jgi:pimeloyl-ACP methyl ester carboxylesterase